MAARAGGLCLAAPRPVAGGETWAVERVRALRAGVPSHGAARADGATNRRGPTPEAWWVAVRRLGQAFVPVMVIGVLAAATGLVLARMVSGESLAPVGFLFARAGPTARRGA